MSEPFPLEIPDSIRKAAIALEVFFKVNGINEWALMGIQSRRSEPEPAPDLELACHHQAIEILRLTSLVATERAAREQAEANPQVGTCVICGAAIWLKESRMTDERGEFHPICGVKQRAEQAEARLAEALAMMARLHPATVWDLARQHYGSDCKMGCVCSKAHLKNCDDLDEFLSSTAPPPILAELQESRAQCAAILGALKWTGDGYEWNGHEFSPTHGDYREVPHNAIARGAQAITAELERLRDPHKTLAREVTDMETMEKMPIALWLVEAKKARSALAALKAENATFKEWDEKLHACLAAATGSAVSIHYREGGKFDSLTASTVRKLAANYAALKAELEQEKRWKIEDPRMLREQIRVADVAFNRLHKEHVALKAEADRLREWFQNSYNVERCEFSPTDWKTLRDNALAERDALKLKLEVASPLLEKLAAIARIHELYESEPCNNPRHPDDRVVAWSGHGNEYVEVSLGECRKAREALAQLNDTEEKK